MFWVPAEPWPKQGGPGGCADSRVHLDLPSAAVPGTYPTADKALLQCGKPSLPLWEVCRLFPGTSAWRTLGKAHKAGVFLDGDHFIAHHIKLRLKVVHQHLPFG